jgi:DNA-directed RNA polymerase subunit M/transcription elongation factor TFIIS
MKKMEFCPDCGRVLSVRERESDYRMIGFCRCGFSKEIERGFLPSEKTIFLEKGEGVLEKENDMQGFPHKCSKCGGEEADVFDLGASYSDESNIYLFKCRKCGYVSREAEGSGNK